jgi:hypothetical protein
MARNFRTAVLVVHGMGSQRPLETVRGIINAVWFDDDNHTKDKRHKLWSHPQPSGVDIDLTVMTTNEVTRESDRLADFHELYWAHQMSETKGVAVLLWLFELGRRGPFFRTGMNGLWWCGAVYLCLLLLSVSLLALQGLIWVTGIEKTPYDFIIVVAVMLFIGVAGSTIAAYWYRYWRLCAVLAASVVIFAAAASLAWYCGLFNGGSSLQVTAAWLTKVFFAPALALVAVYILMKRWGVCAFILTYGLSLMFFVVFILLQWANSGWQIVIDGILAGDVAWGLPSSPSTIAAFTIIGVYMLIDAAFLQPYLGDAARYFRNSPANVAARRAIRKNAVDTLDQLHRCRHYDRVVVVAHSLGTAVAYDMLRAYYSRICNQITADVDLTEKFKQLDDGKLECDAMRAAGRRLIETLAKRSAILSEASRQGGYQPAKSDEVDVWLVTDFVTLGSPLAHAKYLMTSEGSGTKLEQAFFDHVHEREFPTCPPQKLDNDGLIFFTSPHSGPRFHHGGMFALTRWTNLYFPIRSIFWGDAIGGPVKPVFAPYSSDGNPNMRPPCCVEDVPVSTRADGGPAFFTHVAYWKTDCPQRREAPHIVALRRAVNLKDA